MPTTSLNLANIQGNSIGGFNKDFQANLFLKFKSTEAGCAWIKEISDEGAKSNSAAAIQFKKQFSPPKAQGINQPEAIISALSGKLAPSFHRLTSLIEA